MNKLRTWILILFGAGLLLFGIVQFFIIPKQDAAKEQYEKEQQHPLTHDLDYILRWKNDYMGNASNTSQLFLHLPLSKEVKDFELNSDELEAIIHYGSTVENIGAEKVQKSLIYNSTAAFALLGNLEKVTYRFHDQAFSIDRKTVEEHYGELEELLKDKDKWNKEVRDPLANISYVRKRFSLFH